MAGSIHQGVNDTTSSIVPNDLSPASLSSEPANLTGTRSKEVAPSLSTNADSSHSHGGSDSAADNDRRALSPTAEGKVEREGFNVISKGSPAEEDEQQGRSASKTELHLPAVTARSHEGNRTTDMPPPSLSSLNVSAPGPSSLSAKSHPTRLSAEQTKTARLEAQIAGLESQIAATKAQVTQTLRDYSRAKYPRDDDPESSPAPDLNDAEQSHVLRDAETTLQHHIKLLHKYNEIRDIGMGLCGVIADGRGVRLQTVLDEFGITGKD